MEERTGQENTAETETTKGLRVGIAQLNPVVGDVDGNQLAMIEAGRALEEAGADLVVFGEMSLCGYPLEDLVAEGGFAGYVEQKAVELQNVARVPWVVGGVRVGQTVETSDSEDRWLYNTAWVVGPGICEVYDKQLLPDYGVFDETRFFAKGQKPMVIDVKGTRVGVLVCEDAWADGPAKELVGEIEHLVVLNASPYTAEKHERRTRVIGERAKQVRTGVTYVNLIGGQDEIVFDGASFVMNDKGEITYQLPAFEEALRVVDVGNEDVHSDELGGAIYPGKEESMWKALVWGVKDYVEKNGFDKVWIGLSGGIDSAIVAAIAADAIGGDKVHCLAMPSQYSSPESEAGARKLADTLGASLHVVPIENAYKAFMGGLIQEGGVLEGHQPDITEENVQARLRGMTLMAMTNARGGIVLSTGNKSEMAVGYTTLYGDLAGGYSVIKDVYKTQVWELCRWRNRETEIIPWETINRPPTAELREDQLDSDSLGDYAELDAILKGYIEHKHSIVELVDMFGEDALRVVKMVDLAEYKRRQSPPGVKLTPMSFGRDRRLPITNRWTRTRSNLLPVVRL